MKESKLILMQNRVAKLEQQLVDVMKIIASTQGYSRSVAIALQEHLGKERWEELIKKLEEKETKNQVEQIKKDEKK
jgi:hypothetical protein|tara:strand:+ start:122 stop:349 length:228 start_codon:yes stop_codon:yes gene_type:complete